MKNMILGLALTLAASTSMARELVCRGEVDQNRYVAGGLLSIELKAENLIVDWMKNVTATVVAIGLDGDETTVGRRDQLTSDQNYKPRKYVGYKRYDLSRLIDTKDFSNFGPGDTCDIHVMIPDGADKMNSFQAPVTLNCDQSGGKTILNCELK